MRGEILTIRKAQFLPRVIPFGWYGAAFELGTATCLFAERYDSEDGCVQQRDPAPGKPELAEDDTACQTVWQTCLRNIAVLERRNPRLQASACRPGTGNTLSKSLAGGSGRADRGQRVLINPLCDGLPWARCSWHKPRERVPL